MESRVAADREAATAQHREMSRAGMSAFLGIAKAWGLSVAESQTLLGATSPSTFYRWKRGHFTVLPEDLLKRVSCLLGIFKALNTLFPDPQQADGWIRRPNAAPLFSGRSALERMLVGNEVDLRVVRDYLDAETGGLS